MCTENAGEGFLAVEGDPCELPAVIVQKAGGKAHASAGSDVGERRVVICTVEITDFVGGNQPVLHSFQRRG